MEFLANRNLTGIPIASPRIPIPIDEVGTDSLQVHPSSRVACHQPRPTIFTSRVQFSLSYLPCFAPCDTVNIMARGDISSEHQSAFGFILLKTVLMVLLWGATSSCSTFITPSATIYHDFGKDRSLIRHITVIQNVQLYAQTGRNRYEFDRDRSMEEGQKSVEMAEARFRSKGYPVEQSFLVHAHVNTNEACPPQIEQVFGGDTKRAAAVWVTFRSLSKYTRLRTYCWEPAEKDLIVPSACQVGSSAGGTYLAVFFMESRVASRGRRAGRFWAGVGASMAGGSIADAGVGRAFGNISSMTSADLFLIDSKTGKVVWSDHFQRDEPCLPGNVFGWFIDRFPSN